MEDLKKGNATALLPVGVFLAVYLGAGIFFHDFYSMPAIVAFLMALFVAFLQNRKLCFQEKMRKMACDLANDNFITMCLIFLVAGAFSGAVTAAGGVKSTVNLGLTILPGNFAVVGLFVIGCFISLSMGTSVGTISALAPIAIGISEKTGYGMALCLGAVVSGAMFGDNLSVISDTTIAATKTQGCEMKDKFRTNFFIVLPAAIAAVIIYFIIASRTGYTPNGNLNYNLFQVLPYLVVLIGALLGRNVFGVLAIGIILSLVVGTATGNISGIEIFTSMGNGVKAMYDITVISMIVSCIGSLVKAGGGITWILNFIRKRLCTPKGAVAGIAALAAGVDVTTANNTITIIMTAPIAKEISEEYHIEPRITASLLDIFSSVVQGLLPYGAQLLYASAATAGASVVLSSFDIVPYTFYPMLMMVCGIGWILLRNPSSKNE